MPFQAGNHDDNCKTSHEAIGNWERQPNRIGVFDERERNNQCRTQ